MLSALLNKEVKPSTKPIMPIGWHWPFCLQFKPTIWVLN